MNAMTNAMMNENAGMQDNTAAALALSNDAKLAPSYTGNGCFGEYGGSFVPPVLAEKIGRAHV